MKKFGFSLVQLLVVVTIVSMLSVLCQAEEVTHPMVFRDRVSFRGSTGPDFDSANIFSIGGTKVTVDAATINSIAAQVSTNATTDATCSNLVAKGNVNITGTLTVTGAVTQVATPVFASAGVIAPTNAASRGLTITVNGTNYVVALYPN